MPNPDEAGVFRDESGKIFAYRDQAGNERTMFEVLMTRFEERLERIESHVGDLKVAYQQRADEFARLTKQVSELCNSFHEMTSTMARVLTSNKQVLDDCADNSLEAERLRTGIRVFKWIGAFIVGIAAVLGIIFEIRKKIGG